MYQLDGAFSRRNHGNLRSSDQILEALILNRDGRFNLVKRGLHVGDARRQRAINLQSLGEFAFVTMSLVPRVRYRFSRANKLMKVVPAE
jgi:hypothetical protein